MVATAICPEPHETETEREPAFATIFVPSEIRAIYRPFPLSSENLAMRFPPAFRIRDEMPRLKSSKFILPSNLSDLSKTSFTFQEIYGISDFIGQHCGCWVLLDGSIHTSGIFQKIMPFLYPCDAHVARLHRDGLPYTIKSRFSYVVVNIRFICLPLRLLPYLRFL